MASPSPTALADASETYLSSPDLWSHVTAVPAACVPAKSLQSCPAPCDRVVCSPPGSSVQGTLQAGTLDWAAMLSYCPRSGTHVSYVSSTGRRFFTTSSATSCWAPPNPCPHWLTPAHPSPSQSLPDLILFNGAAALPASQAVKLVAIFN